MLDNSIKKYELDGIYTQIDGSFLWENEISVQDKLYCLSQSYGQEFYGLRLEVWGSRSLAGDLPQYLIEVMDSDNSEVIAVNSPLAMLQFLKTYLPTIRLAAKMLAEQEAIEDVD